MTNMHIPVEKANNRYLFYGIIFLFLFIFIYFFFIPALQPNTSDIYFEKSSISPGEATNLVVFVTNSLGEDAQNVIIKAEAVDSASLNVTGSPQTADIIGDGERRKFVFPVTVFEEVREGVYGVDVTINLGETKKTRVSIEVREA
ncbi:MAG: hypothetical protein V1911_01420 [Candidatus Micrarchaeota archaeon]